VFYIRLYDKEERVRPCMVENTFEQKTLHYLQREPEACVLDD